jgi:hypothetical protein
MVIYTRFGDSHLLRICFLLLARKGAKEQSLFFATYLSFLSLPD